MTATADPTRLCEAIDADEPSGKNLEYDPRFLDLMRRSQGTRESQYGNTIVAAQPPDWRVVEGLAAELCESTRDLRIGVLIVETLTHRTAWDGLIDGFDMMVGWIETMWDSLHPRLDDDDAFIRVNALGRLCEPDRLPAMIARLPLFDVTPHQSLVVADLNRGEHKSDSDNELSDAEIQAAFEQLPLGQLRDIHARCHRAAGGIARLRVAVDSHAGPGSWDDAPLRQPVKACVTRMENELRKRLAATDAVIAAGDSPSPGEMPVEDASVAGGSRPDTPVPASGAITSRHHAAETIDRVIDFFRTHEPSSPVPLVLRRAKHLINRDFVEVVRDLVPGAVIEAGLTGDSGEDGLSVSS